MQRWYSVRIVSGINFFWKYPYTCIGSLSAGIKTAHYSLGVGHCTLMIGKIFQRFRFISGGRLSILQWKQIKSPVFTGLFTGKQNINNKYICLKKIIHIRHRRTGANCKPYPSKKNKTLISVLITQNIHPSYITLSLTLSSSNIYSVYHSLAVGLLLFLNIVVIMRT